MNPNLSEFAATCDEAYALHLAENRALKAGSHAENASLRERRETLLERLNTVLPALQEYRPNHLTSDARAEVARLRERILQTLHLSRENEQLLLRGSLQRPQPTVAPKPPPASTAARAYGA
ncbi:hypothetical protein [Actomonas aquatica]|uniref:Uncharacterized protein n=1 Tax=Actomonas aquatica TaxID=2866162 RepID=A0ABZ1CCE1_9BACT|nr:hypothetical protein [Opitutus sp. WL0086]WRQ89339.1 hypothetical protein K1X11_007955 [Opitutus sp. WL0086]